MIHQVSSCQAHTSPMLGVLAWLFSELLEGDKQTKDKTRVVLNHQHKPRENL